MTLNTLLNEKTEYLSPTQRIKNAKKIVVFGAGGCGERAIGWIRSQGLTAYLVADNDIKKQGQTLDGIVIISPQELKEIYDENMLICIASTWASEISKQLLEMGCNNYIDLSNWIMGLDKHFEQNLIIENINYWNEVHQLLADDESKKVFEGIIKYRLTFNPVYINESIYPQYMHPIVQPEEGDIIIDAGAWQGDTVSSFAKSVNKNCLIYALEPETSNYEILLTTIRKNSLDNIVKPLKYGVSDSSKRVYFNIDKQNSGSYEVVEYDTGLHIDVISIDNLVHEMNFIPNLIKMDIEGSEYDALCGAENTIKEHKPKLQICVYHKWDDIWKLLKKIVDINAEYKFYLGHHTGNITETVLYAV
ncbi:FkbM family methyltransferase [Paenibacillus melissococcoides]|uniref:FkbM family methyltransferase n=1 Tax=Paenibacillus melissococcoides TaxID=2912268 RepID=A0ABN8UCT0_9BACL|nr:MULTISPECIES: FkbM family methyltransferase [Paenibacillus]MEB9894630.1 FkbM family methyltransferase [Bacillus cereus]CAH8248892.1 FkbM family methyltransferase [Paenibacillus melissococcoides]CAH8720708.1 FkbM family methyltransferase [Paenibacillus melissococcoides]CAH8720931.1 FkbM family methyltransferase [Paenibacillus melissococcoides]GIO79224.1 hypothetical protein J6TS7_28340 [Paenibacillus dendritiformis]